ncbi:isoleucine--tRNA ligase [Patescibacteria group bacterium]|nr:MAG: isoleucine--tRNA ligase [Patescibacteria group bacterium]
MLYDANKNEQEILDFWDKDKIFEKSVNERPENKPYVFYDGPPFATGLPHYGHFVPSLMKDIVPRYFTMRGYRVERKWGWDCHGLPVENIIERELNLNSKKDIENFGIDKFNEACRATVLRYAEEWKKTIKRMGRWVDMENDYKTMDLSYMESVWWVFKQLWDKSLIYKGHKAMHICPRCVTPLSNFEVTQNYKDIKDISITVKFRIKNPQKLDLPADSYVLAWTTTPWTLPGNVLLAVNETIEYALAHLVGEETAYIVAKDRIEKVMGDKKYGILKHVAGADLAGLEYEPLFPYFSDTANAFRVVAADFVSTADGTGVVHIAPAFGEDDYNVGKQENIPLVQHVTMEGKFKDQVKDFAGLEVKPKEEPAKTDVEIIKWLARAGKLFSKEKIEHSYPFCWRCDTPLLNYAATSWFVKVAQMKEALLKNNEQINWVPGHIKQGRFGLWLENARDWAISRNRYWGTPLPVWECRQENCGGAVALGSVAEFEKLAGQKISDLHKHIIDKIEFDCPQCGGKMKRIPEVLDCWFESGSMPYGQKHYPFENKAKFEAGFPAEFIAEAQDQTRGWFYTLHVLATALTGAPHSAIPSKQSAPAFKNVIVNGMVLAEDGKKMSKRLRNYPEPDVVMEKYGADAMRYYLATAPVMSAESINFSEDGVREMYNKVLNTLWNVEEFYLMYAGAKLEKKFRPEHVLDRWILAKLQALSEDVTRGMGSYRLVDASRPIMGFIAELSQWYVRRSRDRFKGDDQKDKEQALNTLYVVLNTLAKVMAPFTPFIAEKVYRDLGGEGSVHLQAWPEADKKLADNDVLTEMAVARKVVELGLALRVEQGIKVKQPLKKLLVMSYKLNSELRELVAEELNVKKVELAKGMEHEEGVIWKEEGQLKVGLDMVIDEALKKEGLAREAVRAINQIRKDNKLTISDVVVVKYHTTDRQLLAVFGDFAEEIKKSVLAKELFETEEEGMREVDIGGAKLKLKIE